MVPAEVDSEVVGDANDGDGSEDGRLDWQPGKPGGRNRIPSVFSVMMMICREGKIIGISTLNI